MTSEAIRREAERLAQRFHETYERLAPSFNYETRRASAVAWADVPDPNRALMTATCADLLRDTVLLDTADARALVDALDRAVPGLVDVKHRIRSLVGPTIVDGDGDPVGEAVVVDGVLTCWNARHRLGPCGTCRACVRISFHEAWGEAKDAPGYAKPQWVAAQRALVLRGNGERDARATRNEWSDRVAELAGKQNDDEIARQLAAALFEEFARALYDSTSKRGAMIVSVRKLARCGRIDIAALCTARSEFFATPRGDGLDMAIHLADRLLDHWVEHSGAPGDSAASILSAVIRLVDRGELDLDGFCPPYVDATRETVELMGRRSDPIRASLRILLYANDVLVAESRDRDSWLRVLEHECTPTEKRTLDT